MIGVLLQHEWLRMPRTLPAAMLPESVLRHCRALWTAAVFAAQQAIGLPTAPHAAFKPYGIDAVTMQLPAPPPQVETWLALWVSRPQQQALQDSSTCCRQSRSSAVASRL